MDEYKPYKELEVDTASSIEPYSLQKSTLGAVNNSVLERLLEDYRRPSENREEVTFPELVEQLFQAPPISAGYMQSPDGDYLISQLIDPPRLSQPHASYRTIWLDATSGGGLSLDDALEMARRVRQGAPRPPQLQAIVDTFEDVESLESRGLEAVQASTGYRSSRSLRSRLAYLTRFRTDPLVTPFVFPGEPLEEEPTYDLAEFRRELEAEMKRLLKDQFPR